MVTRKLLTMDGNTAAAHVSYAFTEVAGIYPITPSSPMADLVDRWSAEGRKNIFGNRVKIVEMQSEGGAAGTVHGSLATGALTSTYTASQGLLLMIPNMYKIAGELLPGVFHVTARTITSHALNIFGDHSDVYACRQTGFAMLAESNPQEVMDLAPIAHLAAIEGRVPFLNFFDGFRTSHELQKIEVWDYDDLSDMCNMDAVQSFRSHALNPEHPMMRGSNENGDIFFQHREACNKFYDNLPDIVESYMCKINEKIGTNYKLFNYYGAPDADRVIIAMGSICDVAEEVVDYLNAHGEKVGVVKVRLYRPFKADRLLDVIPETVKKIAVLDRTKEPGALGEPLYLDVVAALATSNRSATVIGGRYGLGSKDTPPSSIFAVYNELNNEEPKKQFTIGIVDDLTNLSLEEVPAPNTADPETIECKFWGLGGDGTVGANKNSIKIIGDYTDKFVQAYFQYDSKKTGGITISHIRFGNKPIRSPYYVQKADFVACHNPSYITKGYRIVNDVKPDGIFLINCPWSDEELYKRLDSDAIKYIRENRIRVFTIDATKIASEIGMGKRTNTILQSAFFALSNVMPEEDAIRYMKEAATKSYLKKGQDVVDTNYKAIDFGAKALNEVDFNSFYNEPTEFIDGAGVDNFVSDKENDNEFDNEYDKTTLLDKMVSDIMEPVSRMEGDSIPVSAFADCADGSFEIGSSKFEKRGIAVTVPSWDASKCVQCNMCSFVCPHAALRPFALDEGELNNAPANTKVAPIIAGKGKDKYSYSIAISPLDCMGCNVCQNVCKVGALKMVSQDDEISQQEVFNYMVDNVTEKQELQDLTVKGSQFKTPLLEFSGSCAGCAQTSYAKLITQLYGDRMFISNATGCSSIWGGPASASPYTKGRDGRGPAWTNSLFEDNAEHGLGMYLGQKTIRDNLKELIVMMLESDLSTDEYKAAAREYLDTYEDSTANKNPAERLIKVLENEAELGCPIAPRVLEQKQYIAKKSVWLFGGDGWAYDIGYGGLDHVLASGENVNIFVFDTEVYSNTGGQSSKASNIGQVAQFAASGKTIAKKSLSEIAMSYKYVYVAQVAMGASPAQTLKAICEAEEYQGPSLIIGYSPCEMHSIKGGMANCQSEMRRAVDCGYWNLFRYNPTLKAQGKNPFILDSKDPSGGYVDFLMNEARYATLMNSSPDRANELFDKSEQEAKERYNHLKKLMSLYEE